MLLTYRVLRPSSDDSQLAGVLGLDPSPTSCFFLCHGDWCADGGQRPQRHLAQRASCIISAVV